MRLMKVMKLCSLVLIGQLTISSCTFFKAPEEPEESKLTQEEKIKIAEYKAEVALGRDMAGRLLQFYGTYGDEDLVGYINQLGAYVASHSDKPDRKYMFAILDTDSVNAFACPGGYILITLGTIRHAKNEAEMAMVLGHEIAHVAHQHMFNTLKNINKKKDSDKNKDDHEDKQDLAKDVRKRPEPTKDESTALLTRYLSQSSGVGLTILQAAKAGMNVLLEKGLDKQLEFEADAKGSEYGIQAGYAPKALISFLVRLEKKKKNLNMKVLDKTHPKISERKEHIMTLLAAMNAKEIIGAYGTNRFQIYHDKIREQKNK